jgi:hypothetical protein
MLRTDRQKLHLCLRPRHETLWGGGGINPRVLNFDTRWRRTVSFSPPPRSQPLYPLGRSSRLDGCKSLQEEEENFYRLHKGCGAIDR